MSFGLCIFIEVNSFFTNCVKFIDFFVVNRYNVICHSEQKNIIAEKPRLFCAIEYTLWRMIVPVLAAKIWIERF